MFGSLLNVGLTRTRVPTATPEDDRGEKAEPRRYALLTLIRYRVGGEGAGGCGGVVVTIVKRAHGVKRRAPAAQRRLTVCPLCLNLSLEAHFSINKTRQYIATEAWAVMGAGLPSLWH